MTRTLLLLCLSMMLFPYAKAQETLLLSFKEAVEIGLRQNQHYRIKTGEQEVLKTERQAALLGHLPRIGLNNSLSQQSGQQFQQVEGELIVTNVNNRRMSSGFYADLPLFQGGRLLNMTKATNLREEAGAYSLEREAQMVVFQIAEQYLQILLDEELYRLAHKNLEDQKQQLRQIEGFVEVGIRTLADQYNQQSEVARLETVALEAQIQLEVDLWQLAETLQLDPDVIPQLAPVPIDDSANQSEFLGLGLETLYELALQNRKDYKAQQLLEAGSKRTLASSHTGLYPQINAYFNYSSFYTSLDDRTFSNQFFDIYPTKTWGINVSIPIFSNFTNRLAIARSRLDHKNQQLTLNALERKLNQETKLAYENYKAAVRREKSTLIQVSSAEEAQKAIQEKFRLGLSNFVDLSQANNQLATAQSDHARATYTLYFQEIVMKFALGLL